MCGRYQITTNAEALRQLFGVPRPGPNLRPRYNMAPSQDAPVVRLGLEGRELTMLRWGLVPHWAHDVKIGYKMINARVETVDSKPSFRDAWRKRRCLVPADAFYEWQPRGKVKQPYMIRMRDRKPSALAGLWERWEKGEAPVESFTIIVGTPNELVGTIHNRMPAIVRPEYWDQWLSGKAGKEALGPYPAQEMEAVPISTRVNNPKNDDPSVIVPVN